MSGKYLSDVRFRLSLWDAVLWYAKMPWNWLRDCFFILKAFWQRGRRGWADCDTWEFDTYVARVIGEMISHSAAHGMGTPASRTGDLDCVRDAEEVDAICATWEHEVQTLACAFTTYAEFMGRYDEHNTDYGKRRYEALIQHMRPLFDYFIHLSN